MAALNFAGAAAATQLNGSINNSTTTIVVDDGSTYPSSNFVIVIDRGGASEEKVLVGTRSGATFSSCTRGYDGTTAASHSDNAVVQHTLPASWCQKVDDIVEADFGTNTALLEAVCPAGTIRATIYGTADPGWLLFNQTIVGGQTLYPTLWPKLPASWKVGADIVLPNITDSDLAQAGATALGATGGANSVVIGTNNIPAHTHPVTVTDPGHLHSIAHDHAKTNVLTSSGGQAFSYTGGGTAGWLAGSASSSNVDPLSLDLANFTGNSDTKTTGITASATANTTTGTALDTRNKHLAVTFQIKAH